VKAREWEDIDIRLLRTAADMLGTYLEHKQAQEELQRAKDAALTAKNEAEEAVRIADAANRAKSEFLANISHELRTPLNAVLGYTQILRHDQELNERQRNGIDIIHRSSEHLLLMINDILDLSKIEAHKMELLTSEFHLVNFLQSIVEITQIRARQRKIAFLHEVQSGLPEYVKGDEKRLRQVLLNLLSNAVKFTEKGRVTLRVKSIEKCRLRIEDSEDPKSQISNLKSQIRFEVEDTGIGIPEHQVAHIFLPFHQLNHPLIHMEGTGLGLAISTRLVQAMGGTLQVSSTPEKGSLFWFDLPLPQAVKPEQNILKARMQERRVIGFTGKSPKILIVDDEELNRELLVDILVPLGFEVAEAVDGQEALEKTRSFAPDLILLDLVMTGMDGFQVVERIRQHPDWQHIQIIAVSASAFQHTRDRSLETGCNDFIAKPLRMKDLLEKLHQLLPIEWVYEARPDDVVEALKSQSEKLIMPPENTLRDLRDLAMKGHLRKILDYLEEMEQQTPQWEQFIENMRTFAKNFHMDQMCQFLEQYLEKE
jgi:signal transduction histidine kinase/DNA-binding response OmpR family regulator